MSDTNIAEEGPPMLRKQQPQSIPSVVTKEGKMYRRVPQPRRLTFDEFGKKFRFQMEEQRKSDEAEITEEDLRWRRLENSARAANIDLCEREKAEGCRNSILHQLAADHVAAITRAMKANTPKVISEEEQQRIELEASLELMLNGSHQERPTDTTPKQPAPSIAIKQRLLPSSGARGYVRKVRSALSTYQRMPNVTHAPLYCAPIGTIALEKERSHKLHAVAHARQELLSIGVVEDKVEQLFDGEINMLSLVHLCEDAARQAAQEHDDGGFMKQLAAIVGAPRPSMVAPSGDGSRVHATGAARSVTPPLSTRSIERALTPAAQSAMARGDHRVPIGREVQRVFRKMQERTVKQSAQAFDFVQSSKRIANAKTEEIIAKFEKDFRESFKNDMANIKSQSISVKYSYFVWTIHDLHSIARVSSIVLFFSLCCRLPRVQQMDAELGLPIAPVAADTHEEPLYPIFIPSKGRSHNRRGTVAQLLASQVPFTLVVEPQEVTQYATLLSSLAAEKGMASPPPATMATIKSLPLSHQGVTYVRNFILNDLAPAHGWFWIMDDDIQGFHRAVNRINVSITATEMFREAMRRMKLNAGAALYSIDYPFYAWQYDDSAVAVNSYNNIAVVMNRSLLPPDINYRFRIREDYDFTLQIILFGQTTVRFRNLSFRVPRMAAAPGGMTDYYEKQKADIAEQNKLFIEMWPSVSREVIKGTGDLMRLDMNIKWMALNPIKCPDPAAILRSKVPLNKPSAGKKNAAGKAPRAVANISAERAPRNRKRRRSSSSSSDDSAVIVEDSATDEDYDDTTSEDDEDLLSTDLEEDDSSHKPRRAKAPAAPRQRPPKPPQPPREKVLPGWKGFTMEKYRDPLPDVIERAGLVRINDTDVKLGSVVLIIPYDLELPGIVRACVVEVTRYPPPKQWNWSAVIEKMRGAPVQTVSSCYRLENENMDLLASIAVIDSVQGGDDEQEAAC